MHLTRHIESEKPGSWPWSTHGDPLNGSLCLEHAAMARQLGVLQLRLGDQLVEQLKELSRLEGDNLLLRAELVRTRTAVLWGLHVAAVTTPPRRPAPATGRVSAPVGRQWDAAQAVICQAGCAGHGHPWLDEAGNCRRTGASCLPQEKAGHGHAEVEPAGRNET